MSIKIEVKIALGIEMTSTRELTYKHSVKLKDVLKDLSLIKESDNENPYVVLCKTKILRMDDTIGETCEIKVMTPFTGG